MKTIEPIDMPCCPFCDNAMLSEQETVVFHCEGSKCLAHHDCVFEMDDDDEQH